jgi:hypothetical protein
LGNRHNFSILFRCEKSAAALSFLTIGKSLARRLAQGEGGEEKILIFEQQIQEFLLGFAWWINQENFGLAATKRLPHVFSCGRAAAPRGNASCGSGQAIEKAQNGNG